MTSQGILEVANPSKYLLENRNQAISGSVIVASARGTRSIFTEIQALVTDVPEGIPPRQIAIGVDRNRLLLVTAVLQRWLGERLGNKNIFVSTAGGIESDDPALDLGIAAAIISSTRGLVFSNKLFWVGELTLSGEVRTTPGIPKLLSEAGRLGFATCVLAKRALGKNKPSSDLRLIGLEQLRGLLPILPGLCQTE
jgi:DNA repair protein RadA/Sms